MAHNTYVKGTYAAWATGTAVSQGDFWKFDQNQYKAINGDEGGTWAPSSAIVIGGSGLQVSGTLSTTATGSVVFNGAFSALGNTEIGASSANTLRVDATSQFYSPVTINTSTSLTTAGALIATGAATFSGAFNINNNATIGSDGTDVLTVHSATTFEGPATTNGTMICAAGLGANAISCSGTIAAFGDFECGGSLVAHGDVTLGDSSTADTITVNGVQSYYGEEYHDDRATFNVGITTGGTSSINEATCYGAFVARSNVTLGDSSANTLTIRSTTQFENNLTVGTDAADSFSVNSSANFLNNVTIGSDHTDTLTSNAAAYFSSVRLGADGGDVIYIPGTTEVAGMLTYTTKTIRDNYEKINLSSNATRYEYHANTLIVTNMNGADRILTIDTIGASAYDGIVKYISHCDETSPGNTLTVLCGHSSRVLGTLTSGQGVRVICDGTQWYTAG